MDALTSLYDKVSPGGFIIVDDYGVLPQCARAVHEFRAARQVTTPLETIDWSGVFWRKEP
jgi:O-methyltransferase